MADTSDNQRPRRTERALRGKPDFYSPSDYEYPFRKYRKRITSCETEIPKKKGRPLKINLDKQQKFDEKDVKEEAVKKSPNKSTLDTTDPDTAGKPGDDTNTVKLPDEDGDMVQTMQNDITEASPVKEEIEKQEAEPRQKPAENHRPHLFTPVRSFVRHSSASSLDTKECRSSGSKDKNTYANLTADKLLQCAIILTEINRKFSTQNFKPS